MSNRTPSADASTRATIARHAIVLAGAALALASSLACGSHGGSKQQGRPTDQIPPILSDAGTPTGIAVSARIGTGGGLIASEDGLLEVSVPAGALGAPVILSIQPVTPTAIGGVGGAYRIRPEGVRLARPVTILLHGPASYASGTSIDDLTIGYQDASGFWFRLTDVTRDAASNTLRVETNHFSDWGLVVSSGVPGLYGPYTLTQSIVDAGPAFQATGNATLFYQGNDATRTLYVSTGSITVPAQIPYGTLTCTPAATTSSTDPAVAELWNATTTAPAQFRWSIRGEWPLTCSSPTTTPVQEFMSAVFDTLGVNLIGCTRGYDTTQPLAFGTDHVQGTYVIDCGTRGKVTGSWNLVACVPGVACPSTQACYAAAISCATGTPVCTIGSPLPAGTSCGTGLQCNGAGTCACAQGADCTPANACVTSQYQCATGSPVCTASTTPVAAGTTCGTNLVCNGAGACVSCAQGADCSPPNACVTSQIQCGTGAPVCTASTTPVAAGTTCGTGLQCNGAGACVCAQGLDCTSPTACVTSQYQCATGTPVCTASTTPVGAGTSCGTNLVCNGTGACVSCVQGADCTPPNACTKSQIQCGTGAPVCTATTTPVASGTSCGAGLQCNGAGACVCAQGVDCTPPSACVTSQYQCATGSPVCTASATPVAAGTSCGTNLVCSGTGACVSCVQGADCTPAGACTQSQIQCGTGAPVCTATTTPVAAGTSCGTNVVCNGAGACVSCVQGADCTPAGACTQSLIQCGSGAPVCTATTTPVAAGTSCGTNLVCSGTGTCVTCAAGTACTSTNACHTAAITCGTGAPVCTDNGNVANGTTCGTNQVCNAGTCTACTAGVACTSTNPCHTAATSCATGTSVCTDTGNVAAGTSCGTGQVCSSTGTCVACVQGQDCTPAGACFQSQIQCGSGGPVCTATTTPVAAGTSCGTGQVCSGTGTCVVCAQGQDCTPAGACLQSLVQCGSGAPVCTGTSTPVANGTGCGLNQVCNAGTCVACTAGVTCTSTNPCHTAATSCATGTSVCTDTGNVPDLTPCGTGLVCRSGVCGP